MCNVSQYAVFVFRARMQLTSFTLVWENIEHRLKIDIYRFKKNNTVRAKPKLWITVKQCYPGSKYGVLEKIRKKINIGCNMRFYARQLKLKKGVKM